jgi:uncharacterized membrane protein YhhN
MLKPIEYLYFVLALIEIFAEATGNEMIRFFTKPLLMIILVFFYLSTVRSPLNKIQKLMIGAFIFSWVGDVALMFVSNTPGEGSLMGIPRNPNYFLFGLVGFLFAHVLYAVAFYNVSNKQAVALLPKKLWVLAPLIVYMVVLLIALLPAIYSNTATQPFLAPVVVYSAAIATMVLFAINRYGRVNKRSFSLVFAGALMFMFSDSFIAINKFLETVPMSGVWIMSLYSFGQYLIAKGSLAQFETTSGT